MSNPGPITNMTAPPPVARGLPIFTIAMLVAIVGIHLYVSSLPYRQADKIFFDYALTPIFLETGSLYAYATLITHAFLHANWTHVLANSYALLLFGLLSERFLGSIRVALVYFVSAISGALLFVAVDPGSQTSLVGASGAISGLFGAAIVSAPASARRALVGNAAIWLGLNVGLPALQSQSGGRIAWEAHLGGFLTGLAVGWLLRATLPRAVIMNQPAASAATPTSAATSAASQAGAKKPEPFNPVQRR